LWGERGPAPMTELCIFGINTKHPVFRSVHCGARGGLPPRKNFASSKKTQNTPSFEVFVVGREGACPQERTLRLRKKHKTPRVSRCLLWGERGPAPKKELCVFEKNIKHPEFRGVCCGARGDRTLTLSPTTDFKSVASADSAIAPAVLIFYLIHPCSQGDKLDSNL